MKITWKTLISLMVFAAFPMSVFAEMKPLLPEMSLWSVVHDKPAAKNWTTTYPLPKEKKVRGGLDTEDGTWLKGKKYVFMTTELILPEDYEPGNLFMQYKHDVGVQIAINGTMVIQCTGSGRQTWGYGVYWKRVPNLLKPGKNIIVVFCEKYADRGVISVSLHTDDQPFMQNTMLFPADSPWSFTFDDPGENWMMRNPLPGGKLGAGLICSGTNGGWPKGKPVIWMTRVVTLPADYKPGRLHAEFYCHNEMRVYINGEEVLLRGRVSNWEFAKNINNLLKPGKNIIAIRCLSHAKDNMAGLDLYLEPWKEGEDNDSGFSMPVRQARPAEEAAEEQHLTDAEKLIEKGMNFLKQGMDKQAVAMLQEAAKTDPEDWQANCILGMLSLTKLYKPADAFAYMQVAIKAEPNNPIVLNNYAVAAMEAKKYTTAVDAWAQVAADYPTLMELVQNVGFFTLLVDNNKIKIAAADQKKLETLYREVCGTRNAVVDVNIGFLLMPPTDGVGSRMDCAAAFVQEYKRGKETIQGSPYEVKRTYFQK